MVSITREIYGMNSKYLLPGIQRTFEWDEDQICKLFDSIMRDIPIGQITVWELSTQDEEYENQKYYTIAQNYITDGQNPFFKDKKKDLSILFEDLNENKHPEDQIDTKKYINAEHINQNLDDTNSGEKANNITLVIDGQQRLTALNIGLNGSIIDYKTNTKRLKSDNWYVKYLYINLLKNPSEESEGKNERYHFEFKTPEEAAQITENEYWFRLNKLIDDQEYEDTLLDHYPRDVIKQKFKSKDKVDIFNENKEIISENLRRLDIQFNKSNGYKFKSSKFTIGNSNSRDDSRNLVKRTFFRLNDSGTTVSEEQKLLATIVLNWSYGGDNNKSNPRDEIYNYISDFNQMNSNKAGDHHIELNLKNLFRSLSSIAIEDVDISYKIDNEKINQLKKYWDSSDPTIRQSLNETAELIVEEMGISEQSCLSSFEALLPIIYFVHHFDHGGIENLKNNYENKKEIKRYLLSVTLSDLTSAGGGTWVDPALNKLKQLREEQQRREKFPYKKIKDAVNENNTKDLEPSTQVIVSNLDSLSYKNNKTELRYILSLLRDNFNKMGTDELDHVFPQKWFNNHNIVKFNSENIRDKQDKEEFKEGWRKLSHSIWNLCLLKDNIHYKKPSNLENDDFDKLASWINREDTDHPYENEKFQSMQKLPEPNFKKYEDKAGIYHLKHFVSFVEERRDMIIREILKELGKNEEERKRFRSTYEFDFEDIRGY